MDDLVAASPAQQMPQDPQPEHERRADPAPARRRIQLQPGAHREDLHAIGCVGAGALVPLAEGQVGDLVAVGRQALGEAPIPALGSPDGMGEQAVVQDADTHPASIPSCTRGYAHRHYPPAQAL